MVDQPKRTAARRLMDLLAAFLHGDGALRLTDLSRHADLSLSTTHRLVQELLDWGGIEQERDGKYRLSRKFLDLASRSTLALRLREQALPHLLSLHQRTGLNVQLAVRDGQDALILEALRPHQNWSGESRIGGRIPLHISSAGLVLLAYSSEAEIEDYLSQPLRKYAENTITAPDDLRVLLGKIRHDKFVVASKFLSNDAGSIAAPIFNEYRDIIAAIGVVYFIERDNPLAIVDHVRGTANRITRVLTTRPGPPAQRTLDFKRRHAGLL